MYLCFSSILAAMVNFHITYRMLLWFYGTTHFLGLDDTVAQQPREVRVRPVIQDLLSDTHE